MRKLFFLSFLMLIFQQGYGEEIDGVLSGQVFHATTMKPLDSVQIEIQSNKKIELFSDQEGNFKSYISSKMSHLKEISSKNLV